MTRPTSGKQAVGELLGGGCGCLTALIALSPIWVTVGLCGLLILGGYAW